METAQTFMEDYQVNVNQLDEEMRDLLDTMKETTAPKDAKQSVKAESRKRVGELRQRLSNKSAKLVSTSDALRKSYRQMMFDEKAKEADEKLSEAENEVKKTIEEVKLLQPDADADWHTLSAKRVEQLLALIKDAGDIPEPFLKKAQEKIDALKDDPDERGKAKLQQLQHALNKTRKQLKEKTSSVQKHAESAQNTLLLKEVDDKVSALEKEIKELDEKAAPLVAVDSSLDVAATETLAAEVQGLVAALSPRFAELNKKATELDNAKADGTIRSRARTMSHRL